MQRWARLGGDALEYGYLKKDTIAGHVPLTSVAFARPAHQFLHISPKHYEEGRTMCLYLRTSKKKYKRLDLIARDQEQFDAMKPVQAFLFFR